MGSRDIISRGVMVCMDGKEIEVFDIEEIYEGCTVQVLRNSKTGEVSIGWWEGTAKDEPLLSNPHGLMS